LYLAGKKEVVVKQYELWQGTQRFLFDGKVMIGGKYRNMIATILLINVPNLINFCFAIDTLAVLI
jgi:hypothetical protein